ncbi:MAG TPA: hypothetical protein VG815_18885, partial [Chloroflexota bacterium]|nr:hypothetical protein [Chloroflexota bacterium]
MAKHTYQRHVRTPYSEVYEVHAGEQRIGRIDLHYASQEVYGTLILEREMPEDDLLELIENL